VSAPGGEDSLMVADAALYGVQSARHSCCCETLREVGFRNASCSLVRKRGHRWILSKREGSQQGLGEYHVSATK